MGLILISLMVNDVENLFKYLLILYISLGKNVCSDLLPIFESVCSRVVEFFIYSEY